MLVVGGREAANAAVSVRQHTKGDLGAVPVDEFIRRITNEISNKLLTSEENRPSRDQIASA